MIKTVLITAVAMGTLSASSQSFVPESQKPGQQEIELTTGPMKIKAATDGISTSMAERSDLSLTLKTKSGFRIRLRF